MKKGKFLLFVFVLMLCVGFSSAMVHAEEPIVTTTEEAENVENVDDVKISYTEQLNDFLDKWSTPIFSLVGGTGGSALVIWLLYRLFKKKLEEHLKGTDNDVDKAKEDLDTAKTDLLSTSDKLSEIALAQEEQLRNCVIEYKNLVETYRKTFDIQANEIDLILSHLSVLKDLICKMVASNPDFASNGYATEIIKICDETNLFELRKQIADSYNELKEGEKNE